jgi:DNA-binding NarL/FixJ family response regulator
MARQQDSSGRKTRVFLVDDELIVRRGLRLLLSGEPDLEVCGEAATEHEALEGILARRPDLAIVDLTLQEGDGLALIKRLKTLCPGLRALVFSMHDQVHFATMAFAAGAQGYVVKEEGTERVLEAIHVVMEGGFYLSHQIAAKAPGLRATIGGSYRTRPL